MAEFALLYINNNAYEYNRVPTFFVGPQIILRNTVGFLCFEAMYHVFPANLTINQIHFMSCFEYKKHIITIIETLCYAS